MLTPSFSHPSHRPHHRSLLSSCVFIVSVIGSFHSLSALGPHEFLLQEECPNNTLVEGVGSYVRGLSRQGAKEFSLLKTGDKSDKSTLFHMNGQTGELYTMQRIDREQLCHPASDPQYGQPFSDLSTDVCHLHFSAINSDRQRLPFRLLIQDINDHAPQWPSSTVQLEFIENSDNNRDLYNTFRDIDRAVDRDSRQNSKITYRLRDESGAGVSRNRALLESPFPFSLTELMNGNLRLQQTASVDRERRDNYNATILAIDNGQPPLTGTLSLHIRVLDLNDNSPVFNASIYRTSSPLAETSAPGTAVLRVFATDSDEGENGRVSYSISQQSTNPASKYFKIDAALGVIEVKSALDFDRGPKLFKFTVLAHDNAPVPYRRTGSTEVEIKLSDMPDESPHIEINPVHLDPMSGDLCIKENNALSVVVAFVQVTDPDFDSNDMIQCKLNNANFSLLHEETQQRNNYKIVTEVTFDRETSPTQRIEIVCTDDAGLKSSKSIRVRILDSNDVTPEFPPLFKFDLVENVAPKSPIFGQIQAKDTDEGENSRLRYSISPLDEAGSNFTVDPVTGNLQALVAFDREAGDKYMFRVLAVDHGEPPRTGTGTVQVNIQDENDCAPLFTQPHYNLSILENSLIGTLVGRVTANDNDVGKNGRVIYILQFYPHAESRAFSDATHFSLDRLSGEIRTRQALDREVKQTYQLTILAFDEISEIVYTKEVEAYLKSQPDPILISLPPHLAKKVGITRVTITVLDSNDNKPVFMVPSGMEDKDLLVLERHDPQGKHILTANATDKDQGLNGEVSYSIVDGNSDNLFQIDPSSGTLFLIRPVHAATKSLYQIKLQACDRAVIEPQHCSISHAIRITIKGLNENLSGMSFLGEESGTGVTRSLPQLSNPNNETVIIVLTIVFLCLLVAVIALVCVIQRKSLGLKRSESPNKLKDNQNNYFPTCDDPMLNHRKDTNVIYEEKSAHQGKVLLTSRLHQGMDPGTMGLATSQDMLASVCSESVHNPLLLQGGYNQQFCSNSMANNIYGSRRPVDNGHLADAVSHSSKGPILNTGRTVSPSYQILDGHLMMNSINSNEFHAYQPVPLSCLNSSHQRDRMNPSPAPQHPPMLNTQHSVVSYHPYFEIKTLDRPRSLTVDRRASGSGLPTNATSQQEDCRDGDHYNAGVATYRRNGTLGGGGGGGGHNSAMSGSIQPHLFSSPYLQQPQSAFHTPYPPGRKFGFAPIKETNSPGSGGAAVGSPLPAGVVPVQQDASGDVNYCCDEKKLDSYEHGGSPEKPVAMKEDSMLHQMGGSLVNMSGFRTLERAPSHTSKYAYDAYKEASFV